MPPILWPIARRLELRLLLLVTLLVVLVALAHSPARAQGGLAPYSSKRSWDAAQPTYDYAGRTIDTSKLQLVWSARTTAGGICDVGADDYTPQNSHGQHTWYAADRNYNAGHSNGPAATLNPYGCVGGNLQLRMGYDAANARWYGWEFNNAGSNNQGREGFLARRTGFYMEATFTLPAVPVGICPFFAPVWTNNRYGNAYFYGLNSVTEYDADEHCSSSPSGGVPTFDALQTSSLHQFPAANLQVGQITVQRDKSFAQDPLFRNVFDGLSHRFGLLSTPSWFISYIDGVEVSRIAKSGQEMNQGSWTFKLSNGYTTVPTAAQSTVQDVILTDAKVYNCFPTLSSCPAG